MLQSLQRYLLCAAHTVGTAQQDTFLKKNSALFIDVLSITIFVASKNVKIEYYYCYLLHTSQVKWFYCQFNHVQSYSTQ